MAVIGSGNSFFNSRIPPSGSPAPPFDPTSADNGLSVDAISGKIVLGDDGSGLADLVSDRQIDIDGFMFTMLNAGAPLLTLIGAANALILGDYLNGNPSTQYVPGSDPNIISQVQTNAGAELVFSEMSITGGLPEFLLQAGDVTGSIGAIISPTQFRIEQQLIAENILLADYANDTYTFGSLNNTGTYFYNDAFGFEIASDNKPAIGQNNYVYQFGDYIKTQNGTNFYVDDNLETVQVLFNQIEPFFSLNRQTNAYSIGDAVNFSVPSLLLDGTQQLASIYAVNGSDEIYSEFNTSTKRFFTTLTDGVRLTDMELNLDFFSIGSGNGSIDKYLNMSWISELIQLGDIDMSNNRLMFEIDIANNVFRFGNDTDTATLEINSIPGFTGTVSPVTSITVEQGIVTNVS